MTTLVPAASRSASDDQSRATLSPSVARNAVVNALGQGLNVVIAFAAVPVIVRGLGTEDFGVLSLMTAAVAYGHLVGAGVGRAIASLGAQAIDRMDEQAFHRIAWSGLLLQALLAGSIAPLLLVLGMTSETASFTSRSVASAQLLVMVTAVSVPLTFLSAGARGILESGQRFGRVNAVVSSSVALSYLALAAVSLSTASLQLVAGVLIGAQALQCFALLAVVAGTFPGLLSGVSASPSTIKQLFRFARWVILSGLTIPVIVYADRFMIASALGASAAGYYAAPFDVLQRILILPTAVVLALVPAISANLSAPMAVGDASARATRFVVLAVAPISVLAIALGRETMALWLGPSFAERAAAAVPLLALGVLANAAGFVPSITLVSVGRPDVPAKLLLVELVPFVLLSWFAINSFGLVGAALAWALRAGADAVFLTLCLFRIWPQSTPPYFSRRNLIGGASTVALVASSAVLIPAPLAIRLPAVLLAAVTWSVLVWLMVLDPGERRLIRRASRGLL